MKETTFDYAEDVISKAVMFAIAAHSGQFRKDGKTPAMVHAMEAAVIASTLTSDPEIMAAAFLHDTVEDTDVVPEQIEKMFGSRIAKLVASETENKRREMSSKDSWQIRKEESINELHEATDINIRILWLSDKLSNMRSFYRSYRKQGSAFWNSFNQSDPVKQEWYYREIEKELEPLKDTAAYEEYVALLNKVFERNEK